MSTEDYVFDDSKPPLQTKTRTFGARRLVGVREMAAWLYRRRRRWCRRAELPVLCVVRAGRMEHIEEEVLIVSLDRMVPAVGATAGTARRPQFVVGELSERSARQSR